MKKFFLLVSCLCLIGCTGPNDPSILALQKTTLAGPGTTLGTLPDGRKVVRYELEMGSNHHNHFLYIVEGTPTITINHTETHGKTQSNHVEVVIDGKPFKVVPLEPDPNQ